MIDRPTERTIRLNEAELRRRVLTEPEFECLSVDLIPDLELAPGDLLAAALAGTEINAPAAAAWEVEAIHESLPGSFFLMPPRTGNLSVADGWNLAYALQEQPGVVDAEPLFETLLDVADQPADESGDDDALEETPPPDAPAEPSAAAPDDCAPVPVDESVHAWSPELIRAPAAWRLPPAKPLGAQRGKGIRIGHPDSGCLDHAELFDPGHEPASRVLAHLGFDFVSDKPDPMHPDGSHGLGTASVAMSADIPVAAGFVHGVAPEAELVPFRVAKKREIIPTPVLFQSGMRKLAKAIFQAVDPPACCHVVSISLGYLRNRAVQKAVRYAFERNVIIVAAAGNYVRFVVWPAAYPQVVAVAGCTARRRKWKGSSRGGEVDVTAPAHKVWKAIPGGDVKPGDGTSFAAASTAGVAALWLAHWGRGHLLAKYDDEFKLTTVFLRVLQRACDPPPSGDGGRFGFGIVNACRVLKTPLPEPEELRAGEAHALEALALAPAPPVARCGLETVAEALGIPAEHLRTPLGVLTRLDPVQVPGALVGVGDELAFHVLVTPYLRDALIPDPEEPPQPEGATAAAWPALDPGRLSGRLRSRLGV